MEMEKELETLAIKSRGRRKRQVEGKNRVERLTKRDEKGRAHYAKMPETSYLPAFYEELAALATECLERLCDFEDKIESGQLVECSVEGGAP